LGRKAVCESVGGDLEGTGGTTPPNLRWGTARGGLAMLAFGQCPVGWQG